MDKKSGSRAAGRRGSKVAALPSRRPAVPPSRFVDLSHTIEHGMVTYPGLPGPLICDYLSREASRHHYAPGVEFQIGKIEMVANTGTYLDSPFHRYQDGKDLAQLPLESLADLDAVVVRVPARLRRAISPEVFQDLQLEGKAVLVQTGWDRHWRTDSYLTGHPYLTGDSAQFLLNAGVALVGIDSLNIDDTDDAARPVHSILLDGDIPIVEHLCKLARLPTSGFRFFALPPKVSGFGSWPVRAFARVLSPG